MKLPAYTLPAVLLLSALAVAGCDTPTTTVTAPAGSTAVINSAAPDPTIVVTPSTPSGNVAL
ncbi:hypothetical protein [Paracoccus pacificus]|uniref:Uncharacterized protein n=1 Tax=Paracoccus pacificus TaxID=1463598 RepID=A0ABW4R5G8_9RHOB